MLMLLRLIPPSTSEKSVERVATFGPIRFNNSTRSALYYLSSDHSLVDRQDGQLLVVPLEPRVAEPGCLIH